MNIVQINSVSGVGSTGRIAVDIANAIEKYGHTCHIAYGHGKSTYYRSYKIGNKVVQLFHNLVFTRVMGLHGYGSIISTYRFTRWMDRIQPDIVHIHNIHANYLNYKILFNYLIKRNIPVVFTLHDCFNFTGKCSHYHSISCYNWKSYCHNCPIFKNTAAPSLFFDFSSKIYNEKKILYSKIKQCAVIAVSNWLKNQAQDSILNVNGHEVDYIYNWVDSNKFKPATSDLIKRFQEKYNLDSGYKYLVSVSQLWDKDSTRYHDALRLAHLLPNSYKLLLIGRVSPGFQIDSLIQHISYLSSQEELSVAYSLADAYVHFSIQDTFGLVIAEAMSCGTIPITFNATACSEIPSNYGIVVPPRDINAIVESLPLIQQKKSASKEMIDYVKHNFDKTLNINKYLKTYKQLLSSSFESGLGSNVHIKK